MAEYLIRVADERGHIREQTEHGISVAEIRERFVQQGFLVYSVKPKGLLSAPAARRKRVKLEQFIIFNQQFVTLIRAGLPIPHSIDLLARRQKNKFLRSIVENVRERVRTGELLSEAFRNAAPGAVSQVYTTTLMAGEKSGNLEEVLTRYITFQRLTLAFRKKLIASMIYPALLITMISVMFTFLISFVVPKFQDLYSQIGSEKLPDLTIFVLGFGATVQHYFWLIITVIAGTAFALWRWSKTTSGAEKIDGVRMKLPVFGEVWLKYQVAVFARMMSTLLMGGLPLVQGLETAGSSMDSPLLSKAVLKSVQGVREGRPLSKTLEETGIVPDLAAEMIEVGESTGALPNMLNSVAEFYEEDVQTALQAALSLIEPVILIVMGLVVAIILISLYLPVFSLGAAATGG
jgi:type IV pilus assembly protein PilC